MVNVGCEHRGGAKVLSSFMPKKKENSGNDFLRQRTGYSIFTGSDLDQSTVRTHVCRPSSKHKTLLFLNVYLYRSLEIEIRLFQLCNARHYLLVPCLHLSQARAELRLPWQCSRGRSSWPSHRIYGHTGGCRHRIRPGTRERRCPRSRGRRGRSQVDRHLVAIEYSSVTSLPRLHHRCCRLPPVSLPGGAGPVSHSEIGLRAADIRIPLDLVS